MGDFGAFQVNRPCRHAYVHLEMDLEPGRYEPTSKEEFEAMEHLAAVPVADGPDGEPGEPFAVKLEDPAVPVPDADMASPVTEEPALAEPPPAAETPPAVEEPPAAPAEPQE